MLRRMIKDDLKRMSAIGDHVCNQLDNYEVHARLARRVIHTGQTLLEWGLKLIEKDVVI